jgi:hypothetical protein
VICVLLWSGCADLLSDGPHSREHDYCSLTDVIKIA